MNATENERESRKEDREKGVAPYCGLCAVRESCQFREIVPELVSKADAFLGFRSLRDAEDLICIAYRLCDMAETTSYSY